jgi:hypothetical protein
MRRNHSVKIYRNLLGYFLLILFCGYLISTTFFRHNHIVNGVIIVHSHPYKSQPESDPVNHNHSNNGFLLIQFISNFIATAPILFFGYAIIRDFLNLRLLIQDENLIINLSHYSDNRPRAPTL